MSDLIIVACTAEMIDADWTQNHCTPGQGLHTTECKAHCLTDHPEIVTCIHERCCEEGDMLL